MIYEEVLQRPCHPAVRITCGWRRKVILIMCMEHWRKGEVCNHKLTLVLLSKTTVTKESHVLLNESPVRQLEASEIGFGSMSQVLVALLYMVWYHLLRPPNTHKPPYSLATPSTPQLQVLKKKKLMISLPVRFPTLLRTECIWLLFVLTLLSQTGNVNGWPSAFPSSSPWVTWLSPLRLLVPCHQLHGQAHLCSSYPLLWPQLDLGLQLPQIWSL